MDFELATKSNEELKKYAKELVNLGFMEKFAPAIGRAKLMDLVDKALMKRQMKLEADARAEATAEAAKVLGMKPGQKVKPSPETLAIRASKKVYVEFLNLENPADDDGPGASLEFNPGPDYYFKMYDGRKHVMPEILVSADKKYAWISRAQRCVIPMFSNKTLPTGDVVSVQVGARPRFRFIILGPAPDDAKFGVVLEEPAKV